MNSVYLRITAKDVTSKKTKDLKIMIDKSGHIMEFKNNSNLFVPIKLSKNATKKLKKAFQICVKNNLNLTQYSECYFTADQIIDGWR